MNIRRILQKEKIATPPPKKKSNKNATEWRKWERDLLWLSFHDERSSAISLWVSRCILSISWGDTLLPLQLVSWVTAHLYIWEMLIKCPQTKSLKLCFYGFHVNPSYSWNGSFQKPHVTFMKTLVIMSSEPSSINANYYFGWICPSAVYYRQQMYVSRGCNYNWYHCLFFKK